MLLESESLTKLIDTVQWKLQAFQVVSTQISKKCVLLARFQKPIASYLNVIQISRQNEALRNV